MRREPVCVLTNHQAAANNTFQVRIITLASDNCSETAFLAHGGDFPYCTGSQGNAIKRMAVTFGFDMVCLLYYGLSFSLALNGFFLLVCWAHLPNYKLFSLWEAISYPRFF